MINGDDIQLNPERRHIFDAETEAAI